MKTFNVMSVDGGDIDYICMSEKDGPDIETYISDRLDTGKYAMNNGKIIYYDVFDDRSAYEHLDSVVVMNKMTKIQNGRFDFLTRES